MSCIAVERSHAQSIEVVESVSPMSPPGLSDWALPGGLYVGYYGPGSLNIKDGGTVRTPDNSFVSSVIGYNVTVNGKDSLWSYTGDLFVGYGSGSGTLAIENGGVARGSYGCIGYSGNDPTVASDARVTGPGSIWENSLSLAVGYYGKGSLTVENGGVVKNSDGYIGLAGIGNVRINGTGSTWTNNGILNVGYGSGNKGP